MVEYFPGYRDEYTRPRYPSLRKSFHARDFKHERIFAGKSSGNLWGRSTHAVQSNTLLVYASAQKNSAMELRELQTRG